MASAYGFTLCRMYGHAWQEASVTVIDRTHVEDVIECLRCGGKRIDILNRVEGSVDSRRYLMPENYYVVGQGRMQRATWRVMYLKGMPRVVGAKRKRRAA